MHCFACNAEVRVASSERVGFRDECSHCGVDLHACKNCVHHDPSAYNECRESSSERVSDRERANRCDYFSPGHATGGSGSERGKALSDLDSLFKK
jgi:hypothetical protein